jgi:hypothetical protein
LDWYLSLLDGMLQSLLSLAWVQFLYGTAVAGLADAKAIGAAMATTARAEAMRFFMNVSPNVVWTEPALLRLF